MSITWPANTDFPQYFLVGSVNDRPKDVQIESDVDQGPPRTRSRYDNAEENYQGVLLFPTKALYLVFVNFFKNVTKNGTRQFTWTHPTEFTSVEMKFVGSYSDAPQTQEIHRVSVTVKVLP